MAARIELFGRQPERVAARELDRIPRLVADHPGVVLGRDLVGFAGSDDEPRSVLPAHLEGARDRVADVAMLAGARAGDRRDVLRPPPGRLKHEAAEGHLVEGDDVDSTGWEMANLVRRREALPLQARHFARVRFDVAARNPPTELPP
jgi:hypothetical protein